jgi:signal transduction histidine kinase
MKRCLSGVFAAALFWAGMGRGAETNELPRLTSARQVRELSREEAARGHPVRLRGVVTFNAPGWFLSFVQDDTGGVYFNSQDPALRAGAEVEVEGISAPGQLFPIIDAPPGGNVTVRTLGPGAWPQPILAAPEKLNGDAYDAQWICLRGKVTEVARLNDGVMLDLVAGGVPLRVAIPRWPQTSPPPGYLRGLEIEVRGVFGPQKTRQYAATTSVVFAPSIDTIEIEHDSLAGLFDRPRQRVESLYTFDLFSGTRLVRVDGQVQAAWPGLGFFVALTNTAGQISKVWVETSAPGKLSPGDLVDVVGWQQIFDKEPLLSDALFRVTGRQPPPARWPLTAKVVQAQPPDIGVQGLPISVEGSLIDQQSSLTEDSLVVEDQGLVFLARYLREGSVRLPKLERDMRLRLGGICIVKRMPHLENLPPGFAFQILLGSPLDVEVVQRPSWLTVRRVLWLCGMIMLLCLLAAGWVVLLHRQVARQAEVIRGQVERGAVAQERARIARELHDSLGQELVGIALQLDSAAARLPESPQKAEQALGIARMMVRHSQAEAKRSVADLRAEELDNVDLPTALADVLQQVVPSSGPAQLQIQVQGSPRRLEGIMEHHLLRIGQEAVANAAHHAHARQILVRVCYGEREVGIEVQDDGCGFDANEATAVASGHFGLLGLRERANKLQGRLRIESQPGAGTLVSVTAPINGDHAP